ncbi:MAG: stage II sporulation protein M [candidate division KSB1 bacterium]|nr:stage II sporulation protein M [candidate division KSB1 bacterium]MDZ7304307.1 stage II sporulation protein M [candidate division KSB1 bacterium]MDZ7313584.1 stage II sporulation protein M [candidate division KSB1 bacterium]
MHLGLLFIIVLSLYLASLLIGFWLGKKGTLDIVWWLERKKRRTFLTDPLTVRIHQWLDKYKMSSLKHKKWFRFGLLIFLNNLLLVAFISRTLYGIIFVIPLFLTIWGGLWQGVSFSNPLVAKPLGSKLDVKPVLTGVFEFGGYIVATVGGVNFGLSFFKNSQNVVASLVVALKDLVYIYPVVVLFLLLGAYFETSLIKSSAPKMDSGLDFDMEKARKLALQMLQNKQG